MNQSELQTVRTKLIFSEKNAVWIDIYCYVLIHVAKRLKTRSWNKAYIDTKPFVSIHREILEALHRHKDAMYRHKGVLYRHKMVMDRLILKKLLKMEKLCTYESTHTHFGSTQAMYESTHGVLDRLILFENRT